jgi:hypothetical protein
LQYVSLPAGTYRLTVELTPESTACYALLNGGAVHGNGADSPLVIEQTLDADMERCLVQLGTNGVGEVGLVRVELDCVKLAASPVPMENSGAMESILLPTDASDAERFAAWETARLAKAITGHAPEITATDNGKPAFRIGRAASMPLPSDLTEDGFFIARDPKGSLNLAGVNDRGTLYAVYHYFTLQGCSWLTPGPEGETLPKRTSLSLPTAPIRRSPPYTVRGTMFSPQIFQMDGGWRFPNYEQLLDWCLRNGLNSLWLAANRTIDFRPWRGGSPMKTLNHSWHLFITDDHPEWWPLVDGKRVKMSPLKLPNQPCTSNPELRAYAVRLIADFFKENPDYDSFALCAEDEPCYWCECENCRKQDRDHGQGPWRRYGDATPLDAGQTTKPLPMSDRTMDFVNYVAREIAKLCPGKKIETYCYGSNREGPVLQKVEDNVIIKYCYYLLAPPNLFPETVTRHLGSWKEAGMRQLAIYDYDNYLYPDSVWSGLRYSFLSLIELHRQYGANQYLPESWQSVWSNPLLYRLRADALWGAKAWSCEKLLAQHCHQYYGAAAESMNAYFLYLDGAFYKGREEMSSRNIKDTNIIYCPELTLDDLDAARAFLNEAQAAVADEPRLKKRVDWVIFAHDQTVQAVILNQKTMDKHCQIAGSKAHEESCRLAETYHFDFSQGCLNRLKSFYLPPLVEKEIVELPLTWRFRPDPEKVGDQQQWFAAPHPDWKSIQVTAPWTEQGYGDFHGEAWYELEFDYTAPETTRLAIYCGAIDGFAWFYLDGKAIGSQLEPPDKMWDQPFAIPLQALANGHHVLHVKVAKDMWAAGIWKPVKLVVLPEP